MELNKISDRVYYLPSEERTDRPVLGYIKGDKYSLAVDAGNSSDHVEKFYRELRELDLRLPDFTVITHWHWDHTFGMHSVSGKTVAGHLTNRQLGEVQEWEWTDEAMEKRLQSGEDIEICDQCIRLEYPDRNKIKIVRAELEFTGVINIDLGGVHCEIKEFTATHSDDSVLVHVPEERVVFIGDAEGTDDYQNQGEYDKARLKEMIRVLEKIDVDIFVLGHDGPESKLEAMSYLRDELDRQD
ncbi:MAG: MBL fold metallo-hydrolase [Dehalococcoidales bacterium]|nr:MAG: MBL fold metallo-hydrolase [Dehalococcoidales bacterium]